MKYFLIALSSLLLIRCARQTQPTGGPKDVAPPELLKSTPDNGQKNFKGNTIELNFDEYVKLKDPKEEILITPSTGAKTKFIAKKNKVIITPELAWLDTTTYSIAFRNGIQDINESNPAEDLHLAFSTGPTIDSLILSGTVSEAFKDKIPERITVAIYQSDTFDIFKHRAAYFTKTNKEGKFRLQNLKAGTYRIYAFEDKNKNGKVESKSELFGFVATPIHLHDNIDSIKIVLVHLDTRPMKVTAVRNSNSISTIRINKAVDSVKITPEKTSLTYTYGDTRSELILYKEFDKTDSIRVRVQASDSIAQKLDTTVYIKYTDNKKISEKYKPSDWLVNFDQTDNTLHAEITSNKLLLNINYDSMYIQIDTIHYETITPKNVTFDTLIKKLRITKHLDINTKEKILTPVLLLGRGAIVTIDNDSSKSQDLKIYIPKAEETGSIAVEVTTKETNYEIQLITPDYKLIKSFRNQKKFTFNHLKPSEYRITIYIDRNNNGRWDPGNIYKNEEPEKIILFKNLENKYTIPVRANWEIGPLNISF